MRHVHADTCLSFHDSTCRERATSRDQDRDLRSRWHSMLEKLEICNRVRGFLECGGVCNK